MDSRYPRFEVDDLDRDVLSFHAAARDLTEGVDRCQKRIKIRRRYPDGHVGAGVFTGPLDALALQLALEICR